MENLNTTEQVSEEKIHPKNKVHHVLAHSYITYLILFLVGVSLDIIFKFKIFTNSIMIPVGLFFLVLATIIIFWAQKSGHDLRKVGEPQTEHFHRGPYRYTRMPTHFGLSLLILGFGFVANAFFIIVTTILSFVITKFIFVEKQENILSEKYGQSYIEYKKKVKF